jgi:hypothetical protein
MTGVAPPPFVDQTSSAASIIVGHSTPRVNPKLSKGMLAATGLPRTSDSSPSNFDRPDTRSCENSERIASCT